MKIPGPTSTKMLSANKETEAPPFKPIDAAKKRVVAKQPGDVKARLRRNKHDIARVNQENDFENSRHFREVKQKMYQYLDFQAQGLIGTRPEPEPALPIKLNDL